MNKPLIIDENGNPREIGDKYQEAFVRLRCFELCGDYSSSRIEKTESGTEYPASMNFKERQDLADWLFQWAMQEEGSDV